MRRPSRLALVAAALGLAALGAWRAGPALTLAAGLAVPATDRWSAGAAVVRDEITLGHAGGTLAADLYRPRRPRGALLLVHGLSAAGRRQPDLVRVARVLARHDWRVLVPHFDGLAAFRLSGREVEAVGVALDHLATGGDPVTVAGFSFGAGPALLAAAERPGVRLAASFGGYADLRAVLAFLTVHPDAEPYNRWKLLRLLADFADDARDRATLGAIADARLANPAHDTRARERELGEAGRAVWALVTNTSAEAVPVLLARLTPGARRALDGLAPLAAMPRLAGRVLIAHGRDDASIPATESARLAAAAGTRAVILETFHHTGPRPFLGRLSAGVADGWRLVGLADALLAARGS